MSGTVVHMSLCVAAFDSHWPKTDPTTLNAMFEFLARNRVAHFVFGGDQFDNEEISHHNKGKIAVEASGELAEHTESFEEQFLKPLNKLLRPDCQRIWIQGNHDHWEEQFAEEHPQVRKLVIRKPKDWKWVGLGEM